MCAPAEKKQSRLKQLLNSNFKWIVTICVEIAWLSWVLRDPEARFGRFTESTPYVGYYYYMSITMVFGSLVAGATSEGGGAVAFPVMTLALGVPTIMARDFSFAIQSFGMTCASVIIFFLRVPLDYEALIWATVGGTVGLIIGLEAIAPFLLPEYSKMFFVSLWLSFVIALFRLNTRKERRVYDSAKESDEALLGVQTGDFGITVGGESADSNSPNEEEFVANGSLAQDIRVTRAKRKRIAILFGIGLFGGFCSSVAGSGLDMATFSILTLYFRVSEKIATPTSVVLMAFNAVVGMCCRLIPIGGAYLPGEKETLWKFVSVCIPVVVVGAPTGAHIPAILSRHQISYIVYFLSVAQFILACAIVQPWGKPAPHGVGLMVASGITLFGGSIFFYKVADWGENRDEETISKTATDDTDIEEVESATEESSVSVVDIAVNTQ